MIKKFLFIAAAVLLIFPIANSQADWNFLRSQKRLHIRVVGSSTVSPLMSSVSEEFARAQNLKNVSTITPVVESTGTHDGFKLFCGGVGYQYPDFVDASSPIRLSEIAECNKNGVHGIGEIKIGYDGIVIGNAIGSKKIKLTKEQLFLALAEKIADKKSGKLIDNPYTNWNQIDDSLPKVDIVIYGPPLTSGTRDVFTELVMERVCMFTNEFITAYPDHDLRKAQCGKIRSDVAFIESGENENVLIRNLKENPNSLGIFGFNFLVANRSVIKAVAIDNVLPTKETIASKSYELSRPLFVYFKKQHIDLISGMSEFVAEIVSPETIGRNGYLLHSGLIALSDFELNEVRKNTLANEK